MDADIWSENNMKIDEYASISTNRSFQLLKFKKKEKMAYVMFVKM